MSNRKTKSNESISNLALGEWEGILQREEICDSVLERKVDFMQAEPIRSFMCWFSVVIHLR